MPNQSLHVLILENQKSIFLSFSNLENLQPESHSAFPFLLQYVSFPCHLPGLSCQVTLILMTFPTMTFCQTMWSWRWRPRRRAGRDESCWPRLTSAGTQTIRLFRYSAQLFSLTLGDDKSQTKQKCCQFSEWLSSGYWDHPPAGRFGWQASALLRCASH